MFQTNLIKEKLTWFIEMAVVKAQRNGLLPESDLPHIELEHPQIANHGDYACNLPLKLARLVKANPLEIAEKISKLIPTFEEFEKIEVASPGFINFTLNNAWLAQQTEAILRNGPSYGNIDIAKGSRVQLEFVSVNPTGPLHVGHGRGAVMGSTLASVLGSAGYSVEKEYYVNDAGAQMEAFYRSLYARYRQALGFPDEIPPDGYHGDYMVELAREVIEEKGNTFLDLPLEQAIAEIGNVGLKKVLGVIEEDLEQLGVIFDIWFSEKSLYESESYQKSARMKN